MRLDEYRVVARPLLHKLLWIIAEFYYSEPTALYQSCVSPQKLGRVVKTKETARHQKSETWTTGGRSSGWETLAGGEDDRASLGPRGGSRQAAAGWPVGGQASCQLKLWVIPVLEAHLASIQAHVSSGACWWEALIFDADSSQQLPRASGIYRSQQTIFFVKLRTC